VGTRARRPFDRHCERIEIDRRHLRGWVVRGIDGQSRAGPQTLRAVVLYCGGVAGGLALALGPWSYQLWTHFRNPLFPYGNQWFGSP
jgi:hypothetical protein